jgi:hypothetical protein
MNVLGIYKKVKSPSAFIICLLISIPGIILFFSSYRELGQLIMCIACLSAGIRQLTENKRNADNIITGVAYLIPIVVFTLLQLMSILH